MNGIYQVKNRTSGKCYIGSSNHVVQANGREGRWEEHLRDLRRGTHYNKRLQRAFTKYGEEEFEFSVLERLPDDTTGEELQEIETYWLHFCWPTGYNSSRFGNRIEMTEEVRQKIGDSNRGKVRSEEDRLRMSEAIKSRGIRPPSQIGRSWNQTSEAREKIRQARIGQPGGMKGRHHTDEAKEKNRQKTRQYWERKREEENS